MIEKKLIKNIVDHIFHPYKKDFIDNNMMHPEREWFTGLIIGIIILGAGGWWSVYSYLKYSNVSLENIETITPESFVYRGSVIEAALNNFSERKKVYDSLLPKSEELNQVFMATTTQSTSTSEVLPPDRSTEIVPSIPQSDPYVGESATKTKSIPSEVATTTAPVTLGE